MNKLQQIAERNAKQWLSNQEAKGLTSVKTEESRMEIFEGSWGHFQEEPIIETAEESRANGYSGKYSLIEPQDVVEFPEKDSKKDDFEQISAYNKSLKLYYRDLARMYGSQARRIEEQYDRELA